MRTVALSEVAEVFNGKTPSKAEKRSSGHPVLKIKDLDSLGDFRGSFESFVDPAFADKQRAKWARSGDTVILNAAHSASHVASKTALLKTNVEGSLLTGEWLVVRPGDSADARYVHYWLTRPPVRAALREAVKGIHLYPRDVAALQIPLPLLPEQRRIAAILDHADAVRAKRRQVLTHLDSLTQSVFDKMFTGAEFPTELLGDRLHFLTSGSRGWAKYYSVEGDKFIRIQNVKNGYLDQRDMAFVTAPNTAEARRTEVRAGDVLLSITADLGRTAVVPDRLGRAFINQHLAILRAPSLLPRYLADFLESPSGRREVLGKDRGATKAGLNFDDIRSVSVPIPPVKVQTAYAERVDAIETQRACLLGATEADNELFASLQARAFRGEL